MKIVLRLCSGRGNPIALSVDEVQSAYWIQIYTLRHLHFEVLRWYLLHWPYKRIGSAFERA